MNTGCPKCASVTQTDQIEGHIRNQVFCLHLQRAASYINNIRPDKHNDIYSVIEQIVAKAIPLWNRTLTPLKEPPNHIEPRVSDWSNSYYGYDRDDKPEQLEGEDEDDHQDRFYVWQDGREIIEPEPPAFKTPLQRLNNANAEKNSLKSPDQEPLVDLWKDFGRLQIIVKLANINLTPEKPTYGGGSWHVEGQANESM